MTPTQRGLTVDRMTTYHGWAGFHYRRGRIRSVLLACVMGVTFAVILFFGASA
jgi:hypothetical protein